MDLSRNELDAHLKRLQLSKHDVGSWLLLFRSELDLNLEGSEPILAMTLMVNRDSLQYVGRVLGRIAVSASMKNFVRDICGLCSEFFEGTGPCFGYLPRDDQFPTSCKFSEGCTKQLTKSTVECFMCLACQEMAQPPLELKDEDDSLVRDQIDTILTDFNEATEVETNHRHKVRRLGKYDRRSCSLCGASLKSLSSLSSHMTLVHFRAYFNCIHCESKYRFANDLTEHILDEHPETPNAECPKCAKIVHLVDDLALSDHHQVCVRGKNRTKVSQNRINRVRADRPHQCDKCGKSYTLIEYLKNHKKKHGQHFKCTQCDFSTTSNQYLKEHEQKHLVQAGLAPKAVCHLCGKELSQNTSLKNHIKFVHSPLNFPCDKCERVFSREKTLTAHKNRVHGESDAFLCGECGHRAGSQMELRDHTRTHDSVLHKCRFCGKLLKSKRTLQNHERLHKNPTGGSADGPEGSNS